MTSALLEAQNVIKWYHHVPASLLRGLTAFNIGPFGGDNSISAVIEAVLLRQKGKSVDYELSKTEAFFVKQLSQQQAMLDIMIEYRELNHAAQNEILRRWKEQVLGVIWIGAGIFTLEHPLLINRKPDDLHVWSDVNPKVVQEARMLFDEMRQRAASVNLSYNIELPQEVDKINRCIDFLVEHGVEHIIIQGYGFTYALAVPENFAWLSKLTRPQGKDMSLVFNAYAPEISFLPGVMAAFHQQAMFCYEKRHVEALFQAAMPGSEIVWTIPRTETRGKEWETWLIHAPAQSEKGTK